MSKKKYSKEFKLKVLHEHEEGASFYSLEKKYDIVFGSIKRWNAAFKAYGEAALDPHNSNLCRYSAEFKQRVVNDYLSGGGSFEFIAIKYGIYAESTVLKWVKLYNSHEELTDSRKVGDYLMAKDIKSRKTTLEERIKIVEHCISNSNDYSATAKEFNCSYGQVYSWVNKYNSKGIEGLKDGRGRNKSEDELSELERLQAEIRILKAEKKAATNGAQSVKKTRRNREEVTLNRTRHLDSYVAIEELSSEHPEYPVSVMCEILGINRAAYYKWKNHANSKNDDLNELIAEKILEIHGEHPDMGYRRIRDTLEHDHDINVNDKRILRVCRKKKVQSYIKHKYNCCTKPASDPAYIVENVLNRDFKSDKPNEKWLTDVSEFKYGAGDDEKKGKIYLSVILDLCGKRPVAFEHSDHNDNPLVFNTFDKAVAANPEATPLFHSDRGYQYTSKAFRQKIIDAGMTQSMSRVARCIDNGPMEGFWGIMKREMYYGKKYKTKEELIKAIEEYINYYTNKRVQRNLCVLTPQEFYEKQLQQAA